MKNLFNYIYTVTVERWGYYDKPVFVSKDLANNALGFYNDIDCEIIVSKNLEPLDPVVELVLVHELRHAWQWYNYPKIGELHKVFLTAGKNLDFVSVSPLEVDARLSEVFLEDRHLLDEYAVDIYDKILNRDIHGMSEYLRSDFVKRSFEDINQYYTTIIHLENKS